MLVPQTTLASSAPVQPIEACAARRRAEAAQQIRPIRRSPCSPSLPTPLVDHRARPTTNMQSDASFSHPAVRVQSLSRCTLPPPPAHRTPANRVCTSSPPIPVASPDATAGSTSTSPAEHHETGAQSFCTAAARSFANYSALDHQPLTPPIRIRSYVIRRSAERPLLRSNPLKLLPASGVWGCPPASCRRLRL